MPDQFSATQSRLCPACGRRVPQTVVTCRCGAAMPPSDTGPASPDTAAPEVAASAFGAGFRAALGIVLAVGVLAFGAYRVYITDPAPPAAGGTAPTSPALAVAPATVEVPAQPTPAPPQWPDLGIEVSPGKETAAASPTITPGTAPAAPLPTATPGGTPLALEDVVSRVMPAVVRVETSSGTGSGFYVRPDTVLTNVHVVGSDLVVTIRRMDGSTSTARVESTSPAVDIAVLRLSSSTPNQATIVLGSARALRVGQEVFAIGSALGALQNTVTRGIVSALRERGTTTLVQTDTAVNPGNSGGPLLDRTGAAVGITTMGYREYQGLNFAVAAEHARDILEGRPQPAARGGADDPVRNLDPSVASESDRVRTNGERIYEQALAEMARAADQLDAQWQQFRGQCYTGRVVGTFDHGWFALISSGALPEAVNPQCTTYYADFARNAVLFRDRMIRLDDEARRAGVYPGTRRDARRKYRLEHDSWSR